MRIETDLEYIGQMGQEREDENLQFRAFLKQLAINDPICPIVFNVLEQLRQELWHRGIYQRA